MKVLIVAAHPDDEVLGCGATAARLAAEGHEVRIVIMGEGVTSSPTPGLKRMLTRSAALAELAPKAGALMGAASVQLHGLPDNRFDSVDLLDVVKLVEGEVSAFEPAAVFTHHGGDLNIDHAIVHRAVLTATRPVPGSSVRDVIAFEVPSAHRMGVPAVRARVQTEPVRRRRCHDRHQRWRLWQSTRRREGRSRIPDPKRRCAPSPPVGGGHRPPGGGSLRGRAVDLAVRPTGLARR